MKPCYTDGFFSVDPVHGFLTIREPLVDLPETYSTLQYIVKNLHNIIKQDDIKIETLTTLVHSYLKDYSEEVDKETDIFIIQALYRSYSFLTSAYLLEPAYIHFKTKGEYGKARNILPRQIAVPYCKVSQKLGAFPWLDYYYAYSFGNAIKINKNGSLNWKNLKMATSFTNGDDETGFIMMHVYINEISNKLIKSIFDSIEQVSNNNYDGLTESLKLNYETMKEMNKRKKEMWIASNFKKYNDFRIFIMGSKGNPKIFEDGVIYEGVSEERQVYCGQSGSQDSIIPTQDIFTGIDKYYPDNELTRQLITFREYRPKCMQEFLKDLSEDMHKINLFKYLKTTFNYTGLVYLLGIVCEVYNFRFGHWNYVKKYIMENTSYPMATGGTEITKWLPNQMKACEEYFNQIKESIYLYSLNEDTTSEFNIIENNMKVMLENN
jgi:indoleamine 2,3-dioxygenase